MQRSPDEKPTPAPSARIRRRERAARRKKDGGRTQAQGASDIDASDNLKIETRNILGLITHFENMQPRCLYAKSLHRPEDESPQVMDAGAISHQSFSTKHPIRAFMENVSMFELNLKPKFWSEAA